MFRIHPLLLASLTATFAFASLPDSLLAQESSIASNSRQLDRAEARPRIVLPAVSIQPIDDREGLAETRAPFHVTIAAPLQERRSNDQDSVYYTQTPLSKFQFVSEKDDVRPKDFFADLKVRSELPAVSQHEVSWVRAGMVHRPFYFEEHCLEQCGQTVPGIRQPFVSGTRFFVRGLFFPVQTLWNRPRALEAIDSTECNHFDE